MTNIPKVSVILTSYNHGSFIAQAIDSILAQTYPNIELIIADDQSKDNSWEVIKSYKDPRIKLFRSEKSERGLINKVIKHGLADGEYIAIAHSDDCWEKDKLQIQVDFLKSNPEVGAVFTKVKVIEKSGNAITDYGVETAAQKYYREAFDQKNRSREEWLRKFFLEGNFLCHPSVLIRRACFEKIGYYNIFFRQLPDFDYWIRVCLKYNIHVIPEELTLFREHGGGGNTSSPTHQNLLRSIYEFYMVLNNYRKINNPEELVKIFPEEAGNLALTGCITEFSLARVGLAANHQAAKIFGIMLLGELMSNLETRERIEKIHGFSLVDYHSLIGENDAFNVIALMEAEKKLSEASTNMEAILKQRQALERENQALKIENKNLLNSVTWKLGAPFRNVQKFLNRNQNIIK